MKNERTTGTGTTKTGAPRGKLFIGRVTWYGGRVKMEKHSNDLKEVAAWLLKNAYKYATTSLSGKMCEGFYSLIWER